MNRLEAFFRDFYYELGLLKGDPAFHLAAVILTAEVLLVYFLVILRPFG